MISTDTSIARKIIGKFSQGHVSLRERSLTKNRVTMTTTVGANTDSVLNAVVGTYNKKEMDGTLIMMDDVKVVADGDVVVSKDDQVLIGSDVFRIISVKEYNPAGVVLGYELQCRK